jgi:predicted PurR-regulated permease PerM
MASLSHPATGAAAPAKSAEASADSAAPISSAAPLAQGDSRGQRRSRMVVSALLILLGLWVVRDFLVPLLWAVLIVVATWPAYRRLRAWLGQHRLAGLAPLIATLATALIIVLPFVVAAMEVSNELKTVSQWLADAKQHPPAAPGWLGHIPLLGAQLEQWWHVHLSRPEAAKELLNQVDTKSVIGSTGDIGLEVLHRTFQFLVMLLTLYFTFRDGSWSARHLMDVADQWLGHPGERLVDRTVTAVRGTVIGTVAVALGEGGLITIGYLIAGVPRPFLFGLLTVAFAMVPLGAWFAFSMVTLVALSDGGAGAAATVFGVGAVVMMTGDYFAQPAIIGANARLPFLWTWIGIFGGLQTFGLVGLFLGPVVMAAILTVWRSWVSGRDTRKA